MYGAQAEIKRVFGVKGFENDVEMYGAQAIILGMPYHDQFENDVEMYGAQAPHPFYQ